MTDIRFIAKQYIDAGWQVVPVIRGAKAATTSWRKKVYAPSDFGPDDNIAGKCGEPSGWRVDVDCDCPEAIVAARELLPRTGLIHGHAGKPDSHYWFRCEGIKTTQFTGIKDTNGKSTMIIEIRSTGGYTVLPPSIHEKTGNLIEWTIERDLMDITPDDLYAGVREVSLAALIGRHYPAQGVRHAAAGHLAGFLLIGGLTGDAVVRILSTAANIAGDTDTRDRENFIRSTIGKHEKGEKVTGGPKLVDEVGEDLVNKMRSWLKMADGDAIEEMNAKHFWVRLGKDDVIGREDASAGVVFQKPRALYTEYANRSIRIGEDDKGKPLMKPLFPAWLESKQRRAYNEVVFAPPPLICRPGDYNLWTGFDVTPSPGRCDRFLEHLFEVVCSGNDEHYKYLTQLTAYLIQYPGLQGEVACVLRGEPGTGKGTFVRALGKIFGRRHFAHLDRVQDLVDFNAMISGKVVVFADEAFWAGDKREIGALKRIITEPTMRVTRMGIDSVEEANCIHLFMATNEEWSVPAQLKERRFFALKVSDKHRGDHEYFIAIEQEMHDGGLAAFVHEMLQVPVTQQDIRRVPLTAELRVQQNMSLPPELRWWQNCLWEGEPFKFGEWVPVRTVYDEYKGSAITSRLLDPIEFGRRMSKYLSADKPKAHRFSGNVIRAWSLRTLEDARKAFDDELSTTTEWPDAGVTSRPPSAKIPF